jgi:hypothetical protein
VTLTQKQRTARSITQTVFFPLPLALDLDNTAEELGISRNKLINICTTLGLQDKNKLRKVLSKGERATNSDPQSSRDEAVKTTTTTTPHQGAHSEEVEAVV